MKDAVLDYLIKLAKTLAAGAVFALVVFLGRAGQLWASEGRLALPVEWSLQQALVAALATGGLNAVAVAVLRQGLRIRVRCLQGLLVALLIWLSAWLPQALVVLWTETPAALQILTPELVWDYSEWATYGVALAACGVAAALLLPSAESQEQDVGWSLWTPFAAFLGMLLAPLVLLGTWALWQGGGMIDAPSPSPLMGPSGWPAVGPLASASLMGLTVSLLFGATHRALAGGWLARALKWTGLYVATIWSPAALFTSALNEVAPFVAFRVVVAVPAMVLVVLIVATGTVRVIPDRPPNRPPEARPGSAMEGP